MTKHTNDVSYLVSPQFPGCGVDMMVKDKNGKIDSFHLITGTELRTYLKHRDRRISIATAIACFSIIFNVLVLLLR